jgi:hypothetical protein
MTEKRRLAIAAPAIRKRMTVLRRVLVLSEDTPLRTLLCVSAAMMSTKVDGWRRVGDGGSRFTKRASC